MDVWEDCYDDGTGDGGTGDPCIDYGDCGGGDPTCRCLDDEQQDPCADAKPGADKATNLSTNANFINAKTNVLGVGDNKEHAIAFGKDANGNIITSTMSTGGAHSSSIPSVSNAFADIHNHPDNGPQSSGDVYGFIDRALGSNLYETRYVVTHDGVVYALIVTNLQAAKTFDSLYTRVEQPPYEPDFPDPIYQDFQDAKLYLKGIMNYSNQIAEEMAMAFVLDKYKSGMALLKQDSNGNFKRLGTTENTQPDGSKTYSQNNCQ